MPYGNEYEHLQNNGFASVSNPYTIEKELPKDPQGDGLAGSGTRSLFNRYSIFFLNNGPTNGEEGTPSGSHMSYFDKPGLWKGTNFNIQTGLENLSCANIIAKTSDGNHNGVDYEWSDFIYCKHYDIIPNNYMITLRRFGSPVGDNLYSKLQCPTPDIARAVGWIDGENNKLEDLMKFTVGFNWATKESSVQELKGTGWGRESNLLSGKWNTWSGRFISAVNNEGESLRASDDQIETFDPFSNKNNLIFGPLDVIKEMLVREKGLTFAQDIKLVFEYELKSYDGVDPKVAFLDLLSHLLILTYNRGEFWGGDHRFIGGARRKSLVGNDALNQLQSGNFQGFLESAFSSISGKFNNMTGGLGLSLEGLQNFGKNMMGNFGNMIIAGGLNAIGRPEMQSLEALLTGEPTGQWHLTIGNPLNPMMVIGNLCLETSDIEILGPLSYNDFPSKIRVTCNLKHGRPRDRSDVMSMFAPQVGRMYYTEPPNSTLYAMNNSSATRLNYKGNVAEKSKQEVLNKFDNQLLTDLKDVQSRFPNHTKGGKSEEKITWAAQWTT